ncbi:hypothetical protein RRG08_005921, partial [Elysia crispata]
VQQENDAGVEHFFSADEIILGPEPERGMSAVSMRAMPMETHSGIGQENSASWVSAGDGQFRITMVTSSGTIFSWDRTLGSAVADTAVTSNTGTVVWFAGK